MSTNSHPVSGTFLLLQNSSPKSMMSPNSIFKFLLLATTLIKASIALEAQFSTYNAITLPIGSHLFTVSKYLFRVIINSTDVNYKSCEAHFHVDQGAGTPSIKATVTASNKIMVTSVQSFDFAPENKEIVRYTVLLIDPYSCTVKVLESPNELIASSPLTPPEVVAREDNTFDVFYWSQTTCSPCRYDENGNGVKVQHDLKPERYRALEFHLHELSRDHNYAYTFDYGGDKSMLKVLDQDFNVISSVNIDHIVRDFADSNVGDASYIGAVLKSPQESFGFNYSLFEFKTQLKPVFSKLVKFSFGEHIVGASIKIDSRGTSYVAYWKDSTYPDGVKIMLARYDANGRPVGDTIEIGRVAFNHQYRAQTFLLQDKQYCLVIHEDGWAKDDLTKIKCFDVANMV